MKRQKRTVKHYQLKTNVHKACSTDPYRPWMTYVVFWDGYAYATDAHVMVRQSLTDIGFQEEDLAMLHGRMMSPRVITALLKASNVSVNEHGILDPEANVQYNWTRNVVELFDESDPKRSFNSVIGIIQDAKKDPVDIENCIGFNPGVVKRALELFPYPAVTRWEFHGRNRGVIITHENRESDTLVLVMPALLNPL